VTVEGATGAAPRTLEVRTSSIVRVARHPLAWVLAGAIVLAFVLRLLAIRQSFWYDEALTVGDNHLGLSHMFSWVYLKETSPPGYFAVAWLWSRVLGNGELGLRLLSVLCGTAVVPVAYAAAARLFDRRAGVIAALLAATSPLVVWYSQEARSYGLFMLLGALSFWAFVGAREAAQPRWLALWALASSLALLVHYFAAFLIVAEAAWLLATPAHRRAVALAIGPVALTGLAIAPVALIQRHGKGLNWIPSIRLSERVGELPGQLVAGLDSPHHALLAGLAFVVIAAGVGWGLASADRERRRGVLVAATIGLAVVVAPLVLALGGLDYLVTRNVIVAWLPLSVAVAGALAAVRVPAAAYAATAALCALGILGVVWVATNAVYQRPAWRDLAQALGPDGQGRVIVAAGGYRPLPLQLYLPDSHRMPARGAAVREVDVVGMRSPRRGACWWGSECNLPSAQPARRSPSRRFAIVGRRRSGQFLLLRLRARSPVLLSPRLEPRLFRRLFRTRRVQEFLLLQSAPGRR
jgi:uncharacterized membrane protein